MKMRDENVRDFTASDLKIDHLYLGAFTTIHQVITPIVCQHLAGGVPVKSRYCRIISQDSDSEHTGYWFLDTGHWSVQKQKKVFHSKPANNRLKDLSK
jgi:hypothetical protein